MGPPLSEDRKIVEERVGISFVASRPAFWADFLVGDSYRRTFFVASSHSDANHLVNLEKSGP